MFLGLKKNISISAVAVLVFLGGIFLLRGEKSSVEKQKKEKCSSMTEIKTVRGDSMEPLFAPEEDVSALMGFYDCNEVSKNDVVLVSYVGNSAPLLKIVKAVPGDTFRLEKKDDIWRIFVNEGIVVNSEKKPYALSDERAKEIQFYERDYNGIIPEKRYLVFGNRIDGSVDSTRFGLLGKESIIAKVEKK